MGWSFTLGLWKRRKFILVVEDSATTASVITSILQSFNYETAVAPTGAEAMTTIAARAPDLILLDVLLPDTNGVILCQRLKADPATRNIPVLYLTSKSETTIEMNRPIHSADGYLTKPVDRLLLINHIDRIFRRR